MTVESSGREEMTVPLGIEVFFPHHKREITGRNVYKEIGYRVFILILTFLCYASYHLSRKPISVVKNSLHKNCSNVLPPPEVTNDSSWCSWAPFDKSNYEELFGVLDVAYLSAYAVGMFCSGYIAERMNLRYFMTIGMLASGFFTAAFGFGYFFNIHSFVYYVIVQVIGGLFQSTGWPSVVTCMGNWYGKGKRGLIMGIWNSHTSVGNILGAIIPGFFAEHEWGWSFVVPGIIIAVLGLIVFMFLVPNPKDVGCEPPDQHGKKTFTSSERQPFEDNTYSSDSLSNGESGIASTGEEGTPLLSSSGEEQDKPISVFQAIMLPGVLEFSLCLFFAKLVSYTFLFWLPKYIGSTTNFDAEKSADLSTLFDVGGILGGIVAGIISDLTGAHGCVCVAMLLAGTPALFLYDHLGNRSFGLSIGLLMICGALVNGPYALITTAVSADLGTQEALRGNAKALATVTAIIDGTGSIGAALGPLLTGLISPTGWSNVFYMLIAADIAAAILLTRVVIVELRNRFCPRTYELVLSTQVPSERGAAYHDK
ncbi:glucose-6-phosphate exchanger SLC37A2-like isoform X1 [Pomacea canaliculata]|uniref:glucose-6-phosphate exchanger SLC37A2-like isoform X1 n=1 Tax=Pomacea canaliculata TaxID=400727 RepID=UPI000D72C7B9|nr:glucose-6-phosphate exchanger SLC37A2-like isoform X1 [Pomacea canaliculata]